MISATVVEMTRMTEEINVKTGKVHVGSAPLVMQSLGIGSCVAVCFYCADKKKGGMAHVSLPDGEDKPLREDYPAEYAYHGINTLLKELKKIGVDEDEITAKLAGGSQMFSKLNFRGKSIGESNIESVTQILKDRKIRVESEDLGGKVGRSIKFYLESGAIEIKKRL